MIGARIRKSGFWLLDLIRGREVYKHYKDISNIMENKTALNNNPGRYLDELLKHATESCKFYEEYYNYNSIKDFPVSNKIMIRDNIEEIKSKKYDHGKLHVVSTSGSTGTPFSITQNKNKRNRIKADLIYFGKICGYSVGDRYVHLRVWSDWKKKKNMTRFKQNLIPIDISKLDNIKLKEICEVLENDKHIRCINGYAKTIDIIAKFFLENNIKSNNVEIVISGAELLTIDMKKRIKKAFRCNVVSRYANEEIGFLAQQPIDDDYFLINDASNHVEFLKLDSDEYAEPGELCRIIVTDLFNYATPLIRYDTGDLAVYEINTTKGRVIKEIQGRQADFIYDTEGNRLVSYSITNRMERFNEIKQFQLIQEDKIIYRILLNMNKEIKIEREIKKLLRSILGEDSELIIEYVDRVEALSSGKFKTIICRYNCGK